MMFAVHGLRCTPPKGSKLLLAVIWAISIISTNSLASIIIRSAVDTFKISNEAPKLPSIENLISRRSELDDVADILKRDLSADIIATSVPETKEGTRSQQEKKHLLLRSSSHNVSGIGGYTLFALPILSSDLMDILNKAQVDLQTRHGSTLLYHVNTTKWSFSVITANTKLPYSSINAVLTRFLKLSASESSSDEVVFTRVGVLLNEGTPIADINISPSRIVNNVSFVPFAGFDHRRNLSTSQPIEIVKISPSGSTCAYEVVDESTALAPFQNADQREKLRTRQLESQVLAHIGQTAFAMTMHLWQRRDGLPVEVKIWALKAVVYVGYWQIIASTLLTMFELGVTGNDLSSGYFEKALGLDSGLYVIGRLVARFVVKVVLPAVNLQTEIFTLDIWRQIFEAFLKPLQEMEEYDNGWAMEGVIYGPGRNDTHSGGVVKETVNHERIILAEWQIWMGDLDEYNN